MSAIITLPLYAIITHMLIYARYNMPPLLPRLYRHCRCYAITLIRATPDFFFLSCHAAISWILRVILSACHASFATYVAAAQNVYRRLLFFITLVA